MKNSNKIFLIGGIVLVLIVVFILFSSEDDVLEKVLEENVIERADEVVDFDRYNYDYVDEEVTQILTSKIGSEGKVAFYLPPTGYINVSKNEKYGVAFALNNPKPSGENYFVFNWSVDDSVVENCGVSVDVAQGWIERGWTSWGKIPKGWVDCMTVYFAFPLDAPSCNVKYNFEVLKDGVIHGTEVIEFNIGSA